MSDKDFALEPKLRQKMLDWLSPVRWVLRGGDEAEAVPAGSDPLDRVLAARGLDTPEKKKSFLDASIADLPDPFLFRDMRRACAIIDAVLRGENPRILVFGDYDADGLTASAVLTRWFRSAGIDPEILIPDRLEDGYGLSDALVEEILIHRPDLVVTVDTGTSSSALIARLLSEGIRVVVTDHHLPTMDFDRDQTPLINPAAEGEATPFLDLSGAGVAFMLTEALDRTRGVQSPVRDSLAVLAAVGMIADVMDLTGVNRMIVRHGLASFALSAPAGLKALFSMTRRGETSAVTSRDIAFSVSPRLNAAGRMGDVRLALDLLLEDDTERADILASKLDLLNSERRRVEGEVFDEALKAVSRECGGATPPIAIAHGKAWHPGVLGIVSSRLVDRLRVPAITLREEGGFMTGSARSFGTINLIRGLDAAKSFLIRYGGHSGAAGLHLRSEHYGAFREAISAYIRSLPKSQRDVRIEADALLDGREIDKTMVERLERLEPTGQRFEKAVFLVRDLVIEKLARVGEGRHLKLRLRTMDESMRSFDAILFHKGDDAPFYEAGDVVDLLATPELHVWHGRETLQLTGMDLRPADSRAQDRRALNALKTLHSACGAEELHGWLTMTPTLFVALWQFLSELGADGNGSLSFLPSRLGWLLSHRFHVQTDAFGALAALAVFADVGLCRLSVEESGCVVFAPLSRTSERPNLASSSLWNCLLRFNVLQTEQ